MIETVRGTTHLRATEKIYRDKPGQEGARELIYNEGDYVTEEDAKLLGLLPEDKAMRGPREQPKRTRSAPKGKASRDKQLAAPESDSEPEPEPDPKPDEEDEDG